MNTYSKLVLSFFFIIVSSSVCAQSLRYMDESGQLHFVDSIYQVPPRYRNQVLVPTPVPTGKARIVRPTPKPRPTKTPRPPKNDPRKKQAPNVGSTSLIGNYPAPGQIPVQNNQVGPRQPRAPYPVLQAPVIPSGVPEGVINPSIFTPTPTATPTETIVLPTNTPAPPTATPTPTLTPTRTQTPKATFTYTFEETLLLEQQQ
jgi:hypothetical protein